MAKSRHAAALSLIPVLFLASRPTAAGGTDNSDHYCGRSWSDASASCWTPCPTGTDAECAAVLGDAYGCHGYTGCRPPPDANAAAPGHTPPRADVADGAADRFCGASWGAAMRACAAPCPVGDECLAPVSCFAVSRKRSARSLVQFHEC